MLLQVEGYLVVWQTAHERTRQQPRRGDEEGEYHQHASSDHRPRVVSQLLDARGAEQKERECNRNDQCDAMKHDA